MVTLSTVMFIVGSCTETLLNMTGFVVVFDVSVIPVLFTTTLSLYSLFTIIAMRSYAEALFIAPWMVLKHSPEFKLLTFASWASVKTRVIERDCVRFNC